MGFRRKTAEVKQETKQAESNVKGKASADRNTLKGKSSDFVKFGTLMRTKDGERIFVNFNNPDEDKYAKFSEILVDGRKVKSISTSSVEEIVERLVASGHLTEEQAQERLNKTPETILGDVTFILE